MIEKIEIQNFQAHKRLAVEFDEEVTTIVGPSDVGKSAVIRALLWTMTNQPSGQSFIREGANKATSLLFIDGCKIKRSKGKENIYELDEEEFKAFGNGKVPETIESILNISDINYQGQHDAPFWFSRTAGEVSRQLNHIVNLGAIDSTLANLDSEKRKSNQTITIINERMESIKEQGKSLKFIVNCDKELKVVESLAENYEKTSKTRRILAEQIEKAVRYRAIKKDAGELKYEGLLVLDKADSYKTLSEKVEKVATLINQARLYQNVIKNKPPSLKVLDGLESVYQKVINQKEALEKLIGKIESWQEILTQAKLKRKDLEKQLQKALGKKCPLCGAVQNR